eukprot:scaffold11740_cov122-Skeletonema_dohrnii-CCMP3373.AAC.1
MAISAACNNANSVKIANQMVSLEANSFVVRGTIGASGLRATIPPPAWAGRRKERKGSLDARRRVRKADRIPFVLRSGRSDDSSDADAIFECNSNRFVDDNIGDRCFVVVAKAHDDCCDDVVISGSLPIRSLDDDAALIMLLHSVSAKKMHTTMVVACGLLLLLTPPDLASASCLLDLIAI